MYIGAEAFLWGVVSAVSLPAGALLGLWWRPGSKVNSAFMAFGAGALLFALSIELFGHVPHHVEDHGYLPFVAAGVGALLGGLIFDLLNQLLNNRGAFLRSLSNAKKYVARKKAAQAKKLLSELCEVKVLRALPPEQMAELVQMVRKRHYKAGEVIFSQGDQADEMFFIVSGEVEVVRDNGAEKSCHVATLKADDTFGEMGLLTGRSRTAHVKALSDLETFTLEKKDLETLLGGSPELQKSLQELAHQRIDELSLKDENFADDEWRDQAVLRLSQLHMPVTQDEIHHESKEASSKKGAAFAIWLGILIDGIPESLVIGMLAISNTGMSLALIAGVFLANLPEAMSSAVSMRKNGMAVKRIMVMWSSLTLVTGVGAFIGASLFPANPTGSLFYLVLGIEGLAAGAMLTMIAETMLPEAFEQGGSIVGLSTLMGFLAALSVKIL